jgi:hypothetical protein
MRGCSWLVEHGPPVVAAWVCGAQEAFRQAAGRQGAACLDAAGCAWMQLIVEQ